MVAYRVTKFLVLLIAFNLLLSGLIAVAQDNSSDLELLDAVYQGGAQVKSFTVGADGMVGYEDLRSVRYIISDNSVKVDQSSDFPMLRLLLAPESDSESHVRLIVYRSSPEIEEAYGAEGLIEIGPSTFLLNAARPDRETSVIQMTDDGASYRNEMECNSNGSCVYHWFDVGSEITIKGTIELLGAEITSDESYPLTFKMTDEGWILLYGSGEIKPNGEDVIAVGQEDSTESWLSFLESENQLAREAAASALGWLGLNAEEDSRGAIVVGLVAALDDSAWEVKRNAAEALGRLKESTAIEALEGLLEDEEGDGWVAAVAQETLDRINEG